MNPVIGFAILAQVLLTHSSRLVGALAGFAITTGILIWGLLEYSSGPGIVMMNRMVAEPIFLLFCLVWYWFDFKTLMRAFVVARDRSAEPVWPAGLVHPAEDASPYEFTFDKVQR